jgi:RNA polymerase primary sigma factor
MTERERSRNAPREILGQYLAEIARFSQLTAEEERELGRRIRAGDRSALRKLVESHLRFVVSYARRFQNPEVSFLDLIHEGNLGLIQAARRFDPERDNRFLTYAVWWIRQAIIQALQEQRGAMRLPPRRAHLLYRLRKSLDRLSRDLEREPSEEELARETGLSEQEVRDLLRQARSDISLDATIDGDDSFSLQDVLPQTMAPAADELLLRKSFEEAIHLALSSLTPREREVIRLRFGLDGNEPRTLQEIGVAMSISRERVRQIESRALARLRQSKLVRSLVSDAPASAR